MKFARKEFIDGKKSKKKLIIGIVLLLVIFLPFLIRLAFRNLAAFSVKNPFNHGIIKPIGNPGTNEHLIRLFADNNLDIETISIQKDRIEIKIKDGPIVFLKKNDLEKQVTSLQWILERFKIEGRQVKVIDLRFSKIVIK